MEYKVVSINPVQKDQANDKQVAQDFEDMLKKYHTEGWEFHCTQSLKTWVNPAGGCFGFFETPGFYSEKQMVVFKK
ncbi:MAG TPA: hypothetical protein VGC65_11230 [Bacteroidia bacterium]|jgi:hypothetical protein